MGEFKKFKRFSAADSSDRPRKDSDRPRRRFADQDSDRQPRRFGGRDFGRSRGFDVEQFDVTCDKCGRECQVPFKPTGEKPVYCGECFRKGDSFEHRSRTNSSFEPRGRSNSSSDTLDQINTKLDKIMKALKIQ